MAQNHNNVNLMFGQLFIIQPKHFRNDYDFYYNPIEYVAVIMEYCRLNEIVINDNNNNNKNII